jgi:hypothetical protein
VLFYGECNNRNGTWKRAESIATLANAVLTTRSRAQNEAIAPPMECPVTMTGILPYTSIVFCMPPITPSHKVVCYGKQNKIHCEPK